MSPRFWLWTGLVFAVFGVVYWRVAQGQLEGQKAAVMAKQRAVAQELGPKILPFQKRIEDWVQSVSGKWPGSEVTEDLDLEAVQKGPGVYLRLRVQDATAPDRIRKAASRSLRDGFTSCLFRRKAPEVTEGKRCVSSADCDPSFLCNDYQVCARPTQPFNMRLAYRAIKILTSEWTDELHQTTNELAVRAYDRDLDRVTNDDVPIAIEVLTRARYFTLVLDEDPAGGVPDPIADAGLMESEEQRIQRVPHPARVAIWDLGSGDVLLRYRGEASGKFVPMGKTAVADPSVRAAQARQVHSCALAIDVRNTVHAKQQPPPEPSDGGADSAAAGADAGASGQGDP